MALFDAPRTSTERPAGMMDRLFGGLRHWNDSRRTYNTLSALSEHQLTDIGLSRGDIDRISRS